MSLDPITACLNWVRSRLPIDTLQQWMQEKTVPIHQGGIFYFLGGVSLFLFLVQLITGMLLLLYYNPGVDTAYESVQMIMGRVGFGWLVRSLHSWGSNLMIFFVFLHMFSVLFMRAYRKPRELTWFTGCILLGVVVVFGFSGYLLPWNELSFFATRVGTDTGGAIPWVGDTLVKLIRGSEDVTGATLSRFFGLHIAILPGIFTVMLMVHLLLIQVQGISQPVEWEVEPPPKTPSMPFFPNFIIRDILLWLLVLNALAILAVFLPSELGVKADPFAPAPAGIKPEWYFMAMFQTLKWLPPHILGLEGELVGVIAFGLVGLVFFLVPFWDRKSSKGEKAHVVTIFGTLVLIYLAVMTLVGYATSSSG